MKHFSTLFIGLLTVFQLQARTYFISPDGKDSNPGTFQKPFKTFKKAFKVLEAGDLCWVRGGRYHEEVTANNLKGTAFKPIVFKAYQNEKVVIDGTIPLDLKWKIHEGNIYKAKLKDDVWQLFADGKSLTSARWPNGNWYDGSIWNKEKSMAWPEKKKGAYGHHFNAALKDLNFDLKGATIVVNSGSFKTFKSKVIEHQAGADNFKYDTNIKARVHFSYRGKVFKHGYFLENKLGLLDTEGEWFFDVKNKTIYAWPYGNQNPNKIEMKGKRQSYAFSLSKSAHIKFDGFTFFGTTIAAKDCTHITLENNHFLYPSYSKRMLGDLSAMDVTLMKTKAKDADTHHVIRNNKFEYMDGSVIQLNGGKNLFENNYIHSVDYSCTFSGGYTMDFSKTKELTFRRNTVHTAGASEMFKAGEKGLIELNDLSKSGYMQNDGSLIQVSVAAQPKSITRYNWVHESVKQGLRFDNKNTPGAPWGENGTMHHNVSWKTDRIFFKGDNHFIFNNLSFDCHQNDLIISSNKAIQGHNHGTITRNNLANNMSGHRSKPGKDYPLPGIVDHNWAGNFKGGDIRSQLRDPDNLDFRPKKDSELVDKGAPVEGKMIPFEGTAPDIGAYEYGAKSYWIPGFQDAIASVAIPKNKTKNAKTDADLMWLHAYQSKAAHIYFGSDRNVVENATQGSANYKGLFEHNIVNPGQLESGKTYYWRADALMSNGQVRKGNVWQFTVE